MTARPGLTWLVAGAFAVWAPAAPAADIRFGPDGLTIRGPIAPGDYQRLQSVLAREGLARFAALPVMLDSPGGSVIEAEGMERLIDLNRSIVRVRDGRQCLSACILLFAAGSERRIEPRAQLGVHRLRQAAASREGRTPSPLIAGISLDVEAYLLRTGIPEVLVRRMRETPPDRMFRFDAGWLSRNGLDRAIRRRPELAQAVQSRCGPQPNLSGVPMTAWRDCSQAVRLDMRAADLPRLQQLVSAN